MSDENISARIESLVTEEHELRSREESDTAEGLEADAARLRDAGANPDEAKPRDPDTVERYWQ